MIFADLLKSVNPHFSAFRFTTYPSVGAAINATLAGETMLALLPSVTLNYPNYPSSYLAFRIPSPEPTN
jgi:hypothetical protein